MSDKVAQELATLREAAYGGLSFLGLARLALELDTPVARDYADELLQRMSPPWGRVCGRGLGGGHNFVYMDGGDADDNADGGAGFGLGAGTGGGSGHGYGSGRGSGSGYGYGRGSGTGDGDGYGYGDGYGDGYGSGYGYGDGYGDGSGDSDSDSGGSGIGVAEASMCCPLWLY